MPAIDLSQLVTAADKAAAVQACRRAGVNAERARRLAEGAVVAVAGHGAVTLQGRAQDLAALTSLGLAAQARLAAQNDTGFAFRDGANRVHVLTPAQMADLWQKAMAFVEAVHVASWALKDAAGGVPEDYAADRHWPG